VTLVSSIILQAYRECNMLPLGKEPNANQSTEALQLHNATLTAVFGGDAGEGLTDWPLGNFDRESTCPLPFTDYRLRHPTINRRLIAVNDEAIRVHFALRPQDGARMGVADPFSRLEAFPITLDGNGRTIEGTPNVLLDTDGTFQEWMYRADLGDWMKVSNVVAADENPFPDKFDTMFVILLAMRLSPRYGRALPAESVAALKQNKREFVARYLQAMPLEIDDSISWPFMSTQGYDTQRSFTSQHQFNRGEYQ